MRTIRTAVYVLLLAVLPACGATGVTEPEQPASASPTPAQYSDPGETSPRTGGNYIGSGT